MRRQKTRQTHSDGAQGAIGGVGRAGQWFPTPFFGQRARVRLRPSRKPLPGECNENANEVTRWRSVYPGPQPVLAPGGLPPISPRRDKSRLPKGTRQQHTSAASRHSAGKSGLVVFRVLGLIVRCLRRAHGEAPGQFNPALHPLDAHRAARRKKAEVAHRQDEPGGQDMLQKVADELRRRERPSTRADCSPSGIKAPLRCRRREGRVHRIAELGPEDRRRGLARAERSRDRPRAPQALGAIEPAARDHLVDRRAVLELSAPGVQHSKRSSLGQAPPIIKAMTVSLPCRAHSGWHDFHSKP